MKQENEILLQETLLKMLKRINKLELEQREIKADYLKGYRKEKGLEVMDIPPSPVPKRASLSG